MPARKPPRKRVCANESVRARKPARVPKYRVHKASGQGYVVLNGKAVYLGRHDTPEARRRYHQVIAEWLAAGRQSPAERSSITIKELMARYWRHAQSYYVHPDGTPTSQLTAIRDALRPLKQLYGTTRAYDFTPLAYKAVRQQLVDRGLARTTVNQSMDKIKRMFRWAVENELVPSDVYHALQAVAGLRKGRCEAREPEPVRPVPAGHIDAIHPFVSRQVWAMIQVQLLTAARPGEVVAMRPRDLDMSGRVWTYRPAQHKTAHHGHQRVIYIGPRAQEVLRPFLSRPVSAFMFSPAEAEAERRARLHENRKTPLSCGNRPGTNRVANPARPLGDVYTVAAYRRAIARACDLAFPPPASLSRREGETVKAWKARLTPRQKRELAAWRREHRWHPHQLRHNAATELRKEFGLETARVLLGHRSAVITEVYAELDQARAIEAILQVG